jgi:site-specific DNA recombinase
MVTTQQTTTSKTTANLLPAAGYIRMSTDQQEASPARQRAEIEGLAERTGYRVVAWYEDHGLTGTESKNRPNFQRLLADAKKGKFRAILMYEQSRLSREDHFAAIQHWAELRAAKVDMVDCRRGKIDIESLGGFITAIVDQYGAHDESRKLADRTVSGMKHILSTGKRVSGAMLFGFDKLFRDEKGKEVLRVSINEKFDKPKTWTFELVPTADVSTVDAVVWAFEQAKAGESLLSIAKGLNGRRIKTRDGKRFTSHNIRRMLTNPTYAGVLRAGHSSRGKFRRLDEEGITIVSDAHVGIVTGELFRDVQDRIAGLSYSKSPTTAGRYLLSGLLVCDHCGRRLYGRINNDKRLPTPQLSYGCMINEGKGDPDCPRPFVSAPSIEAFILKLIRECILCDENRDALLEAGARWQNQKRYSFEQDQLDEIRRRIERAEENLALADAKDFDSISKLLKKWRSEAAELEKRIQGEQSKIAAPQIAVEAVEALSFVRDNLADFDRVLLSAAIRNTIKEIRVRIRRERKGGYHFKTISGVVNFADNLSSEGAIPFTDADVYPDKKWRVVADAVKSAGHITLAELSRRLGYGNREGALKALQHAVAAGVVEKHPSGTGYVPVNPEQSP